MASDGGKGSAPRPKDVDKETFANNWERIFGKKNNTDKNIMPGEHRHDVDTTCCDQKPLE